MKINSIDRTMIFLGILLLLASFYVGYQVFKDYSQRQENIERSRHPQSKERPISTSKP